MLGHDQRGCKHTLKMLSILMVIFPDVTFMPVEMPGVGQLALLAVLAVPRPTTLRSRWRWRLRVRGVVRPRTIVSITLRG